MKEMIVTMTRKELSDLIEDLMRYCFLTYIPIAPKIPEEPNPDKLLTKREAAQLLNVCTSTIDNYARKKALPRHYVGRVVRFKKADVLAIASPPKKADQ